MVHTGIHTFNDILCIDADAKVDILPAQDQMDCEQKCILCISNIDKELTCFFSFHVMEQVQLSNKKHHKIS